MTWQSFRDKNGQPTHGVVSKTLVKYIYPYDVRFSGYLVIANQARVNDQFVYYPSRRKIVRVNLRSEAVFGTDFCFEDVIPREIEESDYERVADETVSGEPVFVVEVVPKAFAASKYSRVRVYVEKEHFVPLRTRYWDEAGVEVKELRAVPSEVREFDGVWLPMKVTMRNLQLESFTTLVVTNFVPNPQPAAGHLRSLAARIPLSAGPAGAARAARVEERAGDGILRPTSAGNHGQLGAWRSLVARFVRDEEVAGSNPVAPTSIPVTARA